MVTSLGVPIFRVFTGFCHPEVCLCPCQLWRVSHLKFVRQSFLCEGQGSVL